MKLFGRTSVPSKPTSKPLVSAMALPARLALWLGVGVMIWGYKSDQWGLLVIGGVMIVVGSVLWVMNRPATRRKKNQIKTNQIKSHLNQAVQQGKKVLDDLKKAKSQR